MAEYSILKLETLTPCDGYVFELDSVLALFTRLTDSRKVRGIDKRTLTVSSLLAAYSD